MWLARYIKFHSHTLGAYRRTTSSASRTPERIVSAKNTFSHLSRPHLLVHHLFVVPSVLNDVDVLDPPRVHAFSGIKLPAPQTNTTAIAITATMGSLGTYFLDVVYSFTNCMVCFPSSPHLKINSRSFKILRLLGEVSFLILMIMRNGLIAT